MSFGALAQHSFLIVCDQVLKLRTPLISYCKDKVIGSSLF